MWLLSTDRAELHHFSGPEDAEIKGGYAILSHVWARRDSDNRDPEQSFEDVMRIRAECAIKKAGFAERLRGTPPQNTNPRDYVSEKIRRSCITAEKHGYKWIWNDTCCIDKRSSAELSEAINSMYRYYSLAGVCIAYLFDVPHVYPSLPSRDLQDSDTFPFRDSQWHKRGWTLQELIAPQTLVFYSNTWTSLGTKSDLVALLVNATGIPANVLHPTDQKINSYSVAQRLSWMGNRKTTRPEDRAYCLFGILGITMTTLYGEGDRAFLRLQEKIMKTSDDTSIFSWGPQIEWTTIGEFDGDFDGVKPDLAADSAIETDHDKSHRYLLSASHDVFQRSSHVSSGLIPPGTGMLLVEEQEATSLSSKTGAHSPPRRALQQLSSPTVTFSMTQHGLRCHIPVFHAHSFAVAALFCFDTLQQSHLGLILTPCKQRKSPLVYHTGMDLPASYKLESAARIVRLGTGTLRFRGLPAHFRWEEIYITARPPPEAFAAPRRLFDPGPLFGGFRLPHSTFATLVAHGWEHVLNADAPDSWIYPRSFDILFDRQGPEGSRLVFAMGMCSALGSASTHWASFWVISSPRNQAPDDHAPSSHRCPDDHVSEWYDRRKLFTERYSGYAFPFAVAFSRCTVSDSALVLDIAQGKPGLGRFGQSWFRA